MTFMTKLRFFCALILSKIAACFIDLFARGRGTNLPGALALKLDPQFIRHVKGLDPEKTIFITGTNGKSTSTLLLHHILTESGYKVVSNLSGANMTPGVAVPLLRSANLRGVVKTDYVLMETDERYVAAIRKQLPAKYLCVTNIQKDQVQRNGEPSFILGKVRQAVTPEMTLFVNRDDPNACSLGTSGVKKVVRFGVSKHAYSFREVDDFFAVSMPCPVCHNPVRFSTRNLSDMGPFECPVCGLGKEDPDDYVAKEISFAEKHFEIRGREYPFHYNMPAFLYSYTLATAVARELGISEESIYAAFDKFRNENDRVRTRRIGAKTVKYQKMKQENSETLQNIVEAIAADPAEKVFLFGCDEYIDFYPPYVNTCFLFDCDFRRLNESGVARWVCTSAAMGHTVATRFLYDGFSRDKLSVLPDSLEPTLKYDLTQTDCENIYLVEEIPFWKR